MLGMKMECGWDEQKSSNSMLNHRNVHFQHKHLTPQNNPFLTQTLRV